MHQRTIEEHDLVLPWNDGVVVADLVSHCAVWLSLNPQLSSFEGLGFTVKEIHKGDMASGNFTGTVVAVPAEVISVFAGSDLRFHMGNREGFNPQLRYDVRQCHAQTTQNDRLMWP